MYYISYGGGIQSNALLVLAAQNKLEEMPDGFIFSNVGKDSEHPDTIDFVFNKAIPYAKEKGISLEVVNKVNRQGNNLTLWQHLHKPTRSIDIPARMSHSGAPGNRNCTTRFKIKPIKKYLKKLGASKDNPATLGLGITVD